jgi:uncharacterized protein (TIGR02996 family)
MTMQSRERLNYDGHPRAILAIPLTGCDRPIPAFEVVSTGCYRGYHGTWEFRTDTLHLVRLESPDWADDRDYLAEMFPEASGPVEAVWFSGEIVSDETDPADLAHIAWQADNLTPVHFMAFVAVVRLGKLLLETAADLKAGVARSRLTRHAEELFPGEEFAFLRAIQAEPNDVTVKRVYADWLEDRDDPRGPLLRAGAARQEREGPPRVESGTRHGFPTGCVPAENVVWFWRQLAGIPEPTPEEARYQEFRRRLHSRS